MVVTFKDAYNAFHSEELYFTFPKTVKEVYPKLFGDLRNISFPSNLQKVGFYLHEYDAILARCLQAKTITDREQKRQLALVVKDFVKANGFKLHVMERGMNLIEGEAGLLKTLFGLYLFDDDMRDKDMAEWLLHMYGRQLYARLCEDKSNTVC